MEDIGVTITRLTINIVSTGVRIMAIKIKILYAIRKIVLIAHVILFEWLKNKKRKDGGRHLALVRLDAIGDFVLWAGTIKHLRERYNDYRITLIVNEKTYSLAQTLPYWDEIFPINIEQLKYDLIYRRKLLSEISSRPFDVAIHPTYSRDIFTGDSIIRATQAKMRLGVQGDYHNTLKILRLISDSWYTKLITIPNSISFELDRNYQFLSNFLQTKIPSEICYLPSIPLRAELREAINARRYIIIFPGATKPIRHWPIEKYQSLLKKLINILSPDILIILCGGVDEFTLCSSIQAQLTDRTINLAGKTTLADFVELLRSAHLLISNETSAIHIAVAVSTPTICIAGGGHYERFVRYPSRLVPKGQLIVLTHQMPCFGCNWQCTQQLHASGAAPCVASVEVENVVSVSQHLMRNN